MKAQKKALPARTLTEDQYWLEVQTLFIEIEDAVAVYNTYEAIQELAASDKKILAAIQKNSLFWKVQTYSLQSFLFILLGRLFDEDSGVHSIYEVINHTLAHPDFFSKDALIARKRRNGVTGHVLEEFLRHSRVSFPTSKDLRHLEKQLRAYAAQFRKIYRPIRNQVIAHRVITDPDAKFQLFELTNRKELGSSLDFLHDLIKAIEDLYLNGFRPELGTRDAAYREYNQRIKNSVKNVLYTVAGINLET